MASQRNSRHAAAPGREPDGGKRACHGCDDLIQAIDGLHAAILQLTEILKGPVGQVAELRYRTGTQTTDDMLGEVAMAERLGITPRVLAKHRKAGRLPSCWVRNGRQIRWHVHETLVAWKRGVA